MHACLRVHAYMCVSSSSWIAWSSSFPSSLRLFSPPSVCMFAYLHPSIHPSIHVRLRLGEVDRLTRERRFVLFSLKRVGLVHPSKADFAFAFFFDFALCLMRAFVFLFLDDSLVVGMCVCVFVTSSFFLTCSAVVGKEALTMDVQAGSL